MLNVIDKKSTMINKFKHNSKFESIGCYLPPDKISTEDILCQNCHIKDFPLERLLGIKSRRIAGDNEDSFSMAMKAANDCLQNSRYGAEDLDVIIYTAITRFKGKSKYYLEPTMSLFLKNEIGAGHAINFDIVNACAGTTTGIFLLHNMICAGMVNNGMIVSGEKITPILTTALKEIDTFFSDQILSLTVGDSAVAVIMDRSENKNEQIDFIDFITFAEFADLCIGMPSEKNAAPAMYTQTTELDKALNDVFMKYLQTVLDKHGKNLTRDDYDYIVFHQVSVNNLEKYRKAAKEMLDIDLPELLVCVDEYGNTASTSHFLALHVALKNKKIQRIPGF